MWQLLVVGSLVAAVISAAPDRISADGGRVDRVVVDKSERRMWLMSAAHVVATFHVSLGAEPRGHKRREGDERTPEGLYILDWKNAGSGYYRSIHISYPNRADTADAAGRGEDPGGNVMIHGQKNRFGWFAPVLQHFDWTNGCIAVTNAEMQDIWTLVPANTPIEIMP